MKIRLCKFCRDSPIPPKRKTISPLYPPPTNVKLFLDFRQYPEFLPLFGILLLTESSRAENNNVSPTARRKGSELDFCEKRHPLVRVRASAAHGAGLKNPVSRLSQSGLQSRPAWERQNRNRKSEVRKQISEVRRQKHLGAEKVKNRSSKEKALPRTRERLSFQFVKAKFMAESRSRPVLCNIFDLRVEVDVIKNIFVRIVDREGEVSRGRKIQGGGAVGYFSAGRFGAVFKIIPAVLGLGDIA